MIAWSLNAALWTAAGVALLSAVFPLLAVPGDAEVALAGEPDEREDATHGVEHDADDAPDELAAADRGDARQEARDR